MMMNDKAARILDTIEPETDEQKAAITLAKEALKVYRTLQLVPVEDNKFTLVHPDQILHIYCMSDEEMDRAMEIIKKGIEAQ